MSASKIQIIHSTFGFQIKEKQNGVPKKNTDGLVQSTMPTSSLLKFTNGPPESP